MSKRLQVILLGVVVALAMGGSGAYANCLLPFGGFDIKQCADLGFFAPPPTPVTFDASGKPTNVSSVFWQIGFGNHQAGKCTVGSTGLACTTPGVCNGAVCDKTTAVCDIAPICDTGTFLCDSGSNVGLACTVDDDCHTCTAGGHVGGLCTADADCSFCTAGPNTGTCTRNAECTVCSGGPTPGAACGSNSECSGCRCSSGLLNKPCGTGDVPSADAFCNGDNGSGTNGTSISDYTNFVGNDSGVFEPSLRDAIVATGSIAVPVGATCISSNNWANTGVDGCADNVIRTPETGLPTPDDDILNPYYAKGGTTGLLSTRGQQDFPMAFLLKTPTAPFACDHTTADCVSNLCTGGPRAGLSCQRESDCDFCSGGPSASTPCSIDSQCSDSSLVRYFAVAAVASLNRGNTTGNGPCAATPGTNPAPCDFRPGFYAFSDVKNGTPNPADPNLRPNVVPWQAIPRPRAACTAGCTGTSTNRTVTFNWDPVRWFDDDSVRASSNSRMAPADPNHQAGVGFRTFKIKTTSTGSPPANGTNFMGLVRYNLQKAQVTAANISGGSILFNTLSFSDFAGQTEINQNLPLNATGDPNLGTPITRAGVIATPDSCWRVQVRFGKKSEVVTAFPATCLGDYYTTPTCATREAICRLGLCGDRGFTAESLDPNTITCVGGALLSEKAVDVTAVRKLGGIALSWKMTTELSLQGFNIYSVSTKGVEKKIGSLPCQACSTGEPESYTFTAPMTQVKGSKAIILEVLSSLGNSRTQVNF